MTNLHSQVIDEGRAGDVTSLDFGKAFWFISTILRDRLVKVEAGDREIYLLKTVGRQAPGMGASGTRTPLYS